MTRKRLFGPLLVFLFGAIGMASGADHSTLVFKDGSTFDVISLQVVKGSVVVELADGRKQQYDKHNVDLEASGLIPSEPSGSASSPRALTAAKLTMVDDGDNTKGLTISDRDVGHVKRSTRSNQEEYMEDEENPEEPPDIIPLRVSGVRRSVYGGGVTVTGTITNDGAYDLENTTMTGIAVDIDGKSLGQGSVSLASGLVKGTSRSFSLVISVTGDVESIRLSASASEVRSAASSRNPEEGVSESQAPENEDSAADAG